MHPWRNRIAHQIPILTVGGSNPFGCAIQNAEVLPRRFSSSLERIRYLTLTRLAQCATIAITLAVLATSPFGCAKKCCNLCSIFLSKPQVWHIITL